MKIGLDLRMIGGGTGIDRYITELTHEVLGMDKTNQYVLFFRRVDKSTDYRKYNHKIVIADIAHYSFSEQTKFPTILNKEKLDLVHFPHFNVPFFYSKPFVVTIHDLTHTLFPGKRVSHVFHRVAYSLIIRNAIKKSKKIIAVSESTKKAIIDYFGVSPEKIVVTYEGFNKKFGMMDKWEAFQKVSEKFGTKKKYILYVGAWRRYKNLPMLVRAFERLIAKGHDLELVLAGEKDQFSPEIAEEVLKPTKYSDRIKALGRVSDEDLSLLYNASTLFVLPSLIEGFGLIALEAAASGVPLAISDIPTLREVIGQGAEYFDPQNLENMVDVLHELLNNPLRMEELSNLALSRSKHFSWKSTAQQTIQVYNSI